MSKASTLNRQKQANSVDDKEAQEELATLKEIKECIAKCRGMYYHRLLSSVTRHSYEGMFEEVLAEKRLDWAESNIGFLDQTIAKAEGEERHMHEELEREKDGRFNEKDMQELQAWFQDDGLPEMTRSKLLDEKISEFIAKFDAMAKKRLELLSRTEELSDMDAQDLATLRSPKAFFSMDAASRKNLMDRMEALDLATLKGKKKLFSETKAMLDEASDGEGRYLSPAATGTMLKQMLTSDKPEQHRKETLLPSLQTYRNTRVSFDALVTELSLQEEAPIETPGIDVFVQWTTGKRTSFIAEGRRRIDALQHAEEEQEKERSDAKKLIEKYLRMEDWESADVSVNAALELFPEDKELTVMEAYLHEHRTDTDVQKEEREMNLITEEIKAILDTVNPELRTMYIAMVMEGAEAFEQFAENMKRGAAERAKTTAIESSDEPEEDDEVVETGDTTEDQLKVVDEVVRGEEREKALKVTAISADTQERYGRQINDRLQAKLRQLEEGGRKYGKAA